MSHSYDARNGTMYGPCGGALPLAGALDIVTAIERGIGRLLVENSDGTLRWPIANAWARTQDGQERAPLSIWK